MKTAVITVKTDPKTKAQAQKVIDKLGLSLSGVVNAYLHDLVRTQQVSFGLVEEIPNQYLRDALRKSEKERKRGDYYSFKNSDDAMVFLDSIISKKQKKKKKGYKL